MTNKPILQDYAVALKSTGEVEKITVGAYTYVMFLQAAGSFRWSLDGTSYVTGYQGLSIGPYASQQTIFFKAANGVANNLVVFCSNMPISYFPNTREQSTYSTGAKLNSGTTLSTDSAAPTIIPSGNNGHQRKQIVFTCGGDAQGSVQILSSDGTPFCIVNYGQPLTFITDAIFKAYRLTGGGGVNLTVGELYYTN